MHCAAPVCPGASVGQPDDLKGTESCSWGGGQKEKKKKKGQAHSCLANTVLGCLTPLAAVWDASCMDFQHCITKLK